METIQHGQNDKIAKLGFEHHYNRIKYLFSIKNHKVIVFQRSKENTQKKKTGKTYKR